MVNAGLVLHGFADNLKSYINFVEELSYWKNRVTAISFAVCIEKFSQYLFESNNQQSIYSKITEPYLQNDVDNNNDSKFGGHELLQSPNECST